MSQIKINIFRHNQKEGYHILIVEGLEQDISAELCKAFKQFQDVEDTCTEMPNVVAIKFVNIDNENVVKDLKVEIINLTRQIAEANRTNGNGGNKMSGYYFTDDQLKQIALEMADLKQRNESLFRLCTRQTILLSTLLTVSISVALVAIVSIGIKIFILP